MLRSIELQATATTARQEIALVISALYEAVNIAPSDYDNLETHVYGAVSILEKNVGRLIELERALGNDFPLERDAEGVA